MITIKAQSTFGNFKWTGAAEVTQEQLVILGCAGLLQFAQRGPSQEAEKAMAGYTKRPAGFQRSSISFNEANATALEKILSKPIEIADGVTIEMVVGVEEHVPTVAGVVMDTERDLYERTAKAGKLAKLAAKVDYEGEVGNGSRADAPVEFLRAIKAWSIEQVKLMEV